MQVTIIVILQVFFAARGVLKIGESHSDNLQFQLGNIQSRDSFTPIACQRKYSVIITGDRNPGIIVNKQIFLTCPSLVRRMHHRTHSHFCPAGR